MRRTCPTCRTCQRRIGHTAEPESSPAAEAVAAVRPSRSFLTAIRQYSDDSDCVWARVVKQLMAEHPDIFQIPDRRRLELPPVSEEGLTDFHDYLVEHESVVDSIRAWRESRETGSDGRTNRDAS